VKKKYKFSIHGKPLYPHIKLTRERFPRLLITRILSNDDAEYFGAFLNRSNARMLIDFLNRTFKLRSCEIDVDGSFNYPCTMYYKRRCLAPCVADLIGEPDYTEMVGFVRLFLLNERGWLRDSLSTKIQIASDELDFETAAKWRDILSAVEEYWADTRHAVWLDGTSDTFHIRSSNDGLDVFLTSQKGRRVLGERVFSFAGVTEAEGEQVLADVIEQFYKFHAPKEIRVSQDFAGRTKLARALSKKFGRRVPIVLLNEKNQKVSTDLAIYRSSAELDVRRSTISKSARELMAEMKRIFAPPKMPRRISAVDVSHISGTNQVAAAIAWENGRSISNAAEYLLSESSSELETLREFVKQRYDRVTSNTPELLLIDGGRSQLNAALAQISLPSIYIISAVKPQGEHSEVSHFLTAERRIEFDPTSDAHRLLQRLRDEAHEFANAVHRDTRDFANFYEIANILPSLKETERHKMLLQFGSLAEIVKSGRAESAKIIGEKGAELAAKDIDDYKSGNPTQIKPLVVPIRFQEEHGAADDLRPIQTQILKR
jgi:excinuclease ABC subunit C